MIEKFRALRADAPANPGRTRQEMQPIRNRLIPPSDRNRSHEQQSVVSYEPKGYRLILQRRSVDSRLLAVNGQFVHGETEACSSFAARWDPASGRTGPIGSSPGEAWPSWDSALTVLSGPSTSIVAAHL